MKLNTKFFVVLTQLGDIDYYKNCQGEYKSVLKYDNLNYYS